MVLKLVLIGTMIVTSYRSVPSQTDDSPYRTSTGERTNVHGIAVSQELLKQNGGPLEYGDMVYIDGVGFKFVNDCMNARHQNRMDVWVETYAQEHAFEKKFNGKKLAIYRIVK